MGKKNELCVCTNCHYQGKPELRGHFWIEFLLLFAFILPAIIYSVWRTSGKKNLCPECGSATMIPISTPMGQKILSEQKVVT